MKEDGERSIAWRGEKTCLAVLCSSHRQGCLLFLLLLNLRDPHCLHRVSRVILCWWARRESSLARCLSVFYETESIVTTSFKG